MTDYVAHNLLWAVAGMMWGATISLFVVNHFLKKATRRWQAILRRASKHKVAVVTEANRMSPNAFTAFVKVNDVYVVRIFAVSDTDIRLRILDPHGDEVQPQHVALKAPTTKGKTLN